ncbi:MAG: VCBS repeat-containing protein [Planctomycetes bacterium]|nr:VCBS repeat-containing protein [Planctomycetota bacterium]
MVLTSLSFALLALPQAQTPVNLSFDGPVRPGETLQARVSSTDVGAPAFLAVGRGGSFDLAGPGQPLFSVNPYLGGRIFKGAIGANGRYSPSLSIPSSGILPGQRLSWQAAVRASSGLFRLSPRVDMVVDAAFTASWADGSVALPNSVMSQATWSISSGDFDRDGDLDLIVLSESGVLYLENDAGGFQDSTTGRFPSEITYCGGFAAADFNSDSHLDLVFVGRRTSSGNWENPVIALNDGSGNFQIGAELPSDLENGSRVTTGDIDGDSDIDIVITIGGAHSGGGVAFQTIALFRNQGGLQSGVEGSFVEDSVFAGDASFNNDDYTVTNANLGDVDNDGDLDIFVSKTGTQGGYNDLILNDGSGGFQSVGLNQLPGFLDKSGQSVFDDFDGDGYLDIYVCNSHWTVTPDKSGDLMLNAGASAPGYFCGC